MVPKRAPPSKPKGGRAAVRKAAKPARAATSTKAKAQGPAGLGYVDGTVLEDQACPCDPRIADGYSAAAHIELVPANIVGMY